MTRIAQRGIERGAPIGRSPAFHFSFLADIGPAELGLLWKDLYARSTGTVFLSWEWMSSWIAGLDKMPLVLAGEAEGTLALLGLLVPRHRVQALGAIRFDGFLLHTTGRDAADVIAIEYNGFLVDRRFTGAVEREAVRFLLGCRIGRRRFDEIEIKAIARREIAAYCPEGAMFTEVLCKPSWSVDLAEVRAAAGGYLATLSRNTRQQVRRAMRLYEERGPLHAVAAPDTPTAIAWLEELAALHQAQWRAKGKPGGWAFPFFAAFQRRLVEATMPHGMAEIVRVAAGEHVIGYVYNLIAGDHVMAFVTGFAIERDARLKPGLVGHALCIQRHADAGRRAYDFLAGAYRYKASLGRPGPEFVHLHIQRATRMARFERRLRWFYREALSLIGQNYPPRS